MRIGKEVLILNLDDVLPNRFQPRIKFDEQAILELTESIKEHGVIQPIVVRRIADKYEIIAGERRYKASVLAGKSTIPAILADLNDKDSAEVALIENVQRQDLTPIEEAVSYKKILDMGYLNQIDLANKLGKTQSTVANKLRLLNLSDEVQEALLEEKISERHARSLLKLDNNQQKEMLNKIISERLTVRKTDDAIERLLDGDTSVLNTQINKPLETLNFEEKKGGNEMNNNFFNTSQNNPFGQFNNLDKNINKQSNNIEEENINLEESKPIENLFTSPVEPIIEENNTETLSFEKEEEPTNDIFGQQTEKEEEVKQNTSSFSRFFGLLGGKKEEPKEQEEQPRNSQLFDSISINNVNEENNQEISPVIPGYNFTSPIEQPFSQEQNQSEVIVPFAENTDLEEENNKPVEKIDTNDTIEEIQQPIEPLTYNNDYSTEENEEEHVVTINSQPIEHPFSPIMPNYESRPINSIEEEIQPISPFKLDDNQQFDIYENVQSPISIIKPIEEPELRPLIETEEPQITGTINDMINIIREGITSVESNGYEVDSDEMDLEDYYQITIKIAK